MDWVVQLQGVGKRYQGKVVVDDLTFAVRRGECFGLLGPNGAGKTTTLRMLTGLTPLDQGSLLLFGRPMRPEEPDLPHRLGVVPQEDNLDIDLTVGENLLVYGRYFGLPEGTIRQRLPELLLFAQLEERADSPVRTLSGGMRRRLVLARALINDPELLILDEPTTGLDPQARHLIWQRLRTLRERGATLLLTSHYMEEAAQLCDRLLVLDHGRILDLGTPAELIARHVEPEVVVIRPHGGALPDFPHCRVEAVGDTHYCYTDRHREVIDLLHDQPHLTYLHRPANLEDVFLRLTGRELRE